MGLSTAAPPTTTEQSAPAGFTLLLEGFRQRLEREIAGWLAAKREAAHGAAWRELVDGLERLMANGGKRLRPALVYHTYLACAGLHEGDGETASRSPGAAPRSSGTPGSPGAASRSSATSGSPGAVSRSSGALGSPGAASSPDLAEPAAAGLDRQALPLALATEFLHTYLLIHDDIMDHAEVRRGQPSAHVRFRDAHLVRGLRGDAEDFGRSAAILLGDLAHSYAVELFASVLAGLTSPSCRPAPPHSVDGRDAADVHDADDGDDGGDARLAGDAGELARCFSAMCEEVIGGQYLEMVLAHRGAALATAPPPGAAAQPAGLTAELTAVLRLKSGRYTAERPIQLGALLAGAPPPVLALLSRYGCAVGEAFQLQDDLLGMFGDAGAVGKPVGADLREGKFTFLVHHALAAASPAERRTLEEALGNPAASDEEVERVRRLLDTTGARTAVEAMIAERLAQARAALAGLDGFDLRPAGRLFLGGLLDYLRERKQ